jgi:hypothetical protein
MPQRRRAHAKGDGEFGDTHRVRRAYVVDRLAGDRLGGLPGLPQFGALGVQPGVRRVEQGKHLRGRALMGGLNDLLGLHRTRPPRKGSVGQRGLQVQLSIDPVTRGCARRRRQDTVALEIADLLNGVPGTTGDIWL